MGNLSMSGPFDFDENGIDNAIHDNKIGNYALGTKNEKGGLDVSYVGRSDNDLKAELKTRLQTHNHSHFKASYAKSAEEAYRNECQNYHDFDPDKLENKIHPDAPNETNLTCKICGK